MILIEQYFESQVVEEAVADNKKKTYLVGVMAESERKNRNGRIYESGDMRLMEAKINDAAGKGSHILGELDHPSTLNISLENVSHKIVEAKFNNNQLFCKAEILDKSPKGAIAKALIDSGVKLGVSTRGSGRVDESSGKVSNYNFVTIDLVATPSCQSAYPETIEEQLSLHARGNIVSDLAEAAIHDSLAQKYLQIEIRKFIESLRSK